MRELRKTEQTLRKLRRACSLKGGASVRCAADEGLLQLREEAVEADKLRKREQEARQQAQLEEER